MRNSLSASRVYSVELWNQKSCRWPMIKCGISKLLKMRLHKTTQICQNDCSIQFACLFFEREREKKSKVNAFSNLKNRHVSIIHIIQHTIRLIMDREIKFSL